MFKGKSKIVTFLLIFVTVFLVGAIFYISTLLTSGTESETQTSQIAPRKTKAANVTYSKLIALNEVTPDPELTPTPTEEESQETASEQTSISGETFSQPETEGEIEEALTPTPTETVLAYVNPTTTEDASAEASTTVTQTPTKVQDLPDAGFVYNGLIIFAAAMVLVFFSFLF